MHIFSGKNVLPPKFTEHLRLWFLKTSAIEQAAGSSFSTKFGQTDQDFIGAERSVADVLQLSQIDGRRNGPKQHMSRFFRATSVVINHAYLDSPTPLFMPKVNVNTLPIMHR